MKILCLVPAYNEKGNLEELTKKIHFYFTKSKIEYKILFVIQGNDGSCQLLDKLKTKFKKIDYLYFPSALGIGQAYQKGFKSISSSFTHVLTLDADLNHDPLFIGKFIKKMKKTKADLVIGSRYIAGAKFAETRFWKKIISFFMNFLITKILRINIHDLTSGFRLMKCSVVDNLKYKLKEKGYPSYMEFVLLAYKYNYKIEEVSINYKPRKWGVSKMKKWTTFKDYLIFLTKLLFFYHPN